MRNNIYVDIHAIQTVPPSNINRDDTGRPKTAEYGGVTRARVSSQSWKKAIREYFVSKNDKEKLVGIRSLRITKLIADEILKKEEALDMESAIELANNVIKLLDISPKNDKNENEYIIDALFFISKTQARELADIALKYKEEINEKEKKDSTIKDIKKKAVEIMNANHSVDIALFGRMLASNPILNVDASAQVAHAISTHSIQTEFDFFTATDDLSPEDNAGAGMLGTVEFNSSTLYRYANIAVHELLSQLNNDKEATVEAVKLFVEAFTLSMPTGKVNTFANQTLPQAILVTIRKDRPINLVSAFESPVKTKEGYVKKSIDNLKEEYKKIGTFVYKAEREYSIGIEGIGEEKDFKDLLDKLTADLHDIL